jgi:methionyl aminopeptidase
VISIKSKTDILKMRAAGRLVAEVLEAMRAMAVPGVTTADMNAEAERLILAAGATPSFKGYNGFPFATCMSVDDTVVHGFPSKRALKEGDILSVDIGAYLDGFHGDAARTFAIGSISPDKRKLIEVTERCFFEGVKYAKVGCKLGDISAAVQRYAEKFGFSVVRAMTGHGIGRRLHEDPSIPNYGTAGTGVNLKAGYALAIEPMINMGRYDVVIDRGDGWTCRTADGSASAHYENTVIVTDGEAEIITLL